MKPDAFSKQFPVIREVAAPVGSGRPIQCYKMGKLRIAIMPEHEGMPFVASISHNSRYPEWDEMVWVRYELCPGDVDMAMILPPLDEYINYADGRAKFMFTMEAVKYRGLDDVDTE
jgi:hypothetical protein